jgi:hypothetical protein
MGMEAFSIGAPRRRVFYDIGMISRRTLVGALPAAVAAQSRFTDGEAHGDPPYLLEPGWTPLLNGTDMTGWVSQGGKPQQWITTKAVRFNRTGNPQHLGAKPEPGGTILNTSRGYVNNIHTVEKFGGMELYLDFMVPKGSNSGVYLHGLYEVQIFDSYGSWEPMSAVDGGAIYHRWIDDQGVGGSAPRVNASRRPGEWQSYQIWFQAPRFEGGKKTANAKFLKVLHNGVTVQENVEVDGGTRAHMPIPEAETNPLMLQGDHGPVAFRNIYWRPLRKLIHA